MRAVHGWAWVFGFGVAVAAPLSLLVHLPLHGDGGEWLDGLAREARWVAVVAATAWPLTLARRPGDRAVLYLLGGVGALRAAIEVALGPGDVARCLEAAQLAALAVAATERARDARRALPLVGGGAVLLATPWLRVVAALLLCVGIAWAFGALCWSRRSDRDVLAERGERGAQVAFGLRLYGVGVPLLAAGGLVIAFVDPSRSWLYALVILGLYGVVSLGALSVARGAGMPVDRFARDGAAVWGAASAIAIGTAARNAFLTEPIRANADVALGGLGFAWMSFVVALLAMEHGPERAARRLAALHGRGYAVVVVAAFVAGLGTPGLAVAILGLAVFLLVYGVTVLRVAAAIAKRDQPDPF